MIIRRLSVVAIVMATVFLQGCAYAVLYKAMTNGDFYPVKTVEIPYDNNRQARIRLLNGYVTKDSICYGDNPHAAEDLLTRLKSSQVLLTGVAAESISVGMPRSRKYDYFREEVLSANMPVSIRAWIDSSQVHAGTGISVREKCDPGGVYFWPKKGLDYEGMLIKNGATCSIIVKELTDNGEHSATEVPIFRAYAC